MKKAKLIILLSLLLIIGNVLFIWQSHSGYIHGFVMAILTLIYGLYRYALEKHKQYEQRESTIRLYAIRWREENPEQAQKLSEEYERNPKRAKELTRQYKVTERDLFLKYNIVSEVEKHGT